MAGKNNPLRELFISIGLVGAKKATKDLDKLNKSEEELAKTVKKSNKDLDKQEDAFDDVGDEALKAGRKVNRFQRAVSGLAMPFKALMVPLKAILIPLKAIFGLFTGIFKVAGGVLLAQAITAISSAAGSLFRAGVQDARGEEDAILEMQRGMFLQNKYTRPIDQTLRNVSGAIQKKLGISADEILSGLGKLFASGVDPRSGARLANIAAPFAELGGKEVGEILEAIGKTQATGALEEVLSVTMPLLRELTEEQLKSNVLLKTMEKGIRNFSGFKDTTLTKAIRVFQASFSEWIKIFGRPVARGLKNLLTFLNKRLNDFMDRFGKSSGFGATGTMIERLFQSIREVFESSTTPKLIGMLDLALAGLIRTLGRIGVDFARFFMGKESLIGKFLDKAGFKKNIGGLIKFFLQELFSLLLSAFGSALGIAIRGMFKDWPIPFESMVEIFNGNKTAAEFFSNWPIPLQSLGILDGPRPNPNDGAAVQIIQDIKITAENPATVINQMLDASLNRYGNTGRVV